MVSPGTAPAPVQETLPLYDPLRDIPSASLWCQRWRERRQSWRHVSEGGFDHRLFEVDVLSEKEAKRFVLQHHYSRSYPNGLRRFGLFRRGKGGRVLVGSAVFGAPVSAGVLALPFPELTPYVESLECSRFVLIDECPANSESWFLARCFEMLLAAGIRGVVSFADPVPRRNAVGEVIAAGHVGTIYQASNAIYTGRGTARTVKVLPDGTVLHGRSAQKVRRQEQGHEYVEAKLVDLGASAPRPGVDPAVWLREALAQIGARSVRHPGAHRYVFRLGKTRREREDIKLGLPWLRPYPKRGDQ